MLNFLATQTPLKFFAQSLWRDEAFSVLLSRRGIGELLVLTARDFNPPLYYLLLKGWIFLFGSSEIAIRSLSFIFFWATLYVFFLILTNVIKLKEGKTIPYLGLFTINPFLLYFAFEARMYMMFTFFATLSYYFFLTKKKLLYSIVLILGLYTHYMMVFVIFSQLISIPKKTTIKQIALALIIFLPWIIFLFVHHPFIKENFWPLPQPLTTVFRIPGILYTGYDRDFRFYEKDIFWISLTIFGISLISLLAHKKGGHEKYLRIFLVWAFFSPGILFIISIFSPVLVARYVIFSCVGLLLLFTLIFERFSLVPRIIFFLLLLSFALNYNKLQIKYREKSNLRRTLHEIKSLAKKDDVLYVESELDFHVAEYYLDENRVFIYGKSYGEIPSYVGKVLIPKDKIVTQLPHYPKKAFILQEDGSYKIEAIF